jgi:hypothetical protein
MRVAIMQPYFVPYAGYFRLFAAVDTVVLLDTVQFPRRGWVHRNRLRDQTGELAWLTLPLEKGPREILIRELTFPPEAKARLEDQFPRFPALDGPAAQEHPLVTLLTDVTGTPVDYVEKLLGGCCRELDLPFNVIRASTLEGYEELRREELIMALAQGLGATEYVNLSGGMALYDAAEFRARGMKLRVLPDYQGSMESILGRLLTEAPEAVRDEILANL